VECWHDARQERVGDIAPVRLLQRTFVLLTFRIASIDNRNFLVPSALGTYSSFSSCSFILFISHGTGSLVCVN